MNEKDNFYIVIILVVVAIAFGGATGFLVGRGNSVRPAGLEHTNRELTATVRELRTELNRERTITERFGIKQAEERAIIRDALDACGRTGEGLQGIIRKMEILNDLIGELERRAGRGSDLSVD
ncbi:MAG: hypothetical protein LBB81_11000 [Treponema sp.]|jgi:hypothetical protein|nr:hypothetical protein [Treponema sp.]